MPSMNFKAKAPLSPRPATFAASPASGVPIHLPLPFRGSLPVADAHEDNSDETWATWDRVWARGDRVAAEQMRDMDETGQFADTGQVVA